MSEYIERYAAIAALLAKLDEHKHAEFLFGDEIDTIIRNIPAADVVPRDCYDRLLAENEELRKERPVQHGRWTRRCDSIFARCPNCGCEVMQLKSVVFRDEGRIDFCPNCGADMREES